MVCCYCCSSRGAGGYGYVAIIYSASYIFLQFAIIRGKGKVAIIKVRIFSSIAQNFILYLLVPT